MWPGSDSLNREARYSSLRLKLGGHGVIRFAKYGLGLRSQGAHPMRLHAYTRSHTSCQIRSAPIFQDSAYIVRFYGVKSSEIVRSTTIYADWECLLLKASSVVAVPVRPILRLPEVGKFYYSIRTVWFDHLPCVAPLVKGGYSGLLCLKLLC